MKKMLFLAFVILSVKSFAHDTPGDNDPQAHIIPIAIERARVTIEIKDYYRMISANGIPDHKTGQFPNRENPNAISSQSYSFKVPVNPQKNNTFMQVQRQPFGVAINGIPFDPATAECYGQSRGTRPSPAAFCDWSEEAIVGKSGRLGLDSSQAHVQPNGAYHYHGMPYGLINQITNKADLILVGYAADGFGIMISRSGKYRSGYSLKKGSRPNGPKGKYDGTYTQDFEYTGGHLDRCNGAVINNKYTYILTEDFPFIPRCWAGTPDPSFERVKHSGGRGGNIQQRNRPPPPPWAR